MNGIPAQKIAFTEQNTFKTNHMYLNFEFLRIFDFNFESGYYSLRVDGNNLFKILSDYLYSNLSDQESEVLADKEVILQRVCEECVTYKEISQLYDCAKYFRTEPVIFACQMALACLVHFNSFEELEVLMANLGISEQFSEVEDGLEDRFEEMNKLISEGKI